MLTQDQQNRLASEVIVYDKNGQTEDAKDAYFLLAAHVGFEGADDLLGFVMSPAARSALLARLGVIELPTVAGKKS